MPFNGSGVFQRVRNWVADATAGVKIRADFHDAEDDGFAAGLTNCIAKDGQSVVTQNIPFNSKRITGLADPVNPQDAATKAYADTKLSSGAGGGTMGGPLVVTGTVTATGYTTRPGVGGAVGGNSFNINWTGAAADLWIDGTNLGPLATQAYANSVASTAASDRVLRSGDTMSGQLNVNSNIVAAAGSLFSTLAVYLNYPTNTSGVFWADGEIKIRANPSAVDVRIQGDGTVMLANGWKSKAGFSGGYGFDAINAVWSGGQLQFYTNDTPIGAIACDYRIKKNVRPLPGMWETVKALKPIRYAHREFSPPSHIKHIAARRKLAPDLEAPGSLFTDDADERWGFIAHELQQTLVPSVATGVKDDDVHIQSLNPIGIIAALTKTIQEMQDRIEALEGRA
jgi:hypothetical protein